MSSLPLSLLFTFLSTLLLRPYPSGPRGHFGTSAFAFPSALTVLPQQAFASAQTPRSWDVARATQYLMAAWLVVAGGQAISRTVKRVRGGRASAGGGGAGATSGKEGKEVAGGVGIKEADSAVSQATGANKIVKQSSRVAGDICPRPILIALLLHAISWRLAVTLILPDLPGAWKWPFDTTTILGLATGLACSWSEVWRVMRLLGIAGGECGGHCVEDIVGWDMEVSAVSWRLPACWWNGGSGRYVLLNHRVGLTMPALMIPWVAIRIQPRLLMHTNSH